MTVNEYKEATCATAGAHDDTEIEENVVVEPHHHDGEGENLLGRVLAGERWFGCYVLPVSQIKSDCPKTKLFTVM
nr:unnamed protein product [Callosobruchus analis]